MKKALILLLLTVMRVDAQISVGEKVIHGKIVSESAFVSGIEIVNLNNEKIAKTNENGDFFILAKANDVLVFSAKEFEFKRYVIEDEDVVSEIMIIKMIPKIIEIEEVVINEYPEINALALGIISKPAKHYSKAERGKYSQPKGIIDAFKIMVTGKNPARDIAIAAEKNISLLNKIHYLFSDKYYTENLKIPFHYIKGFQYYCIENKALANSLKTKNKTMTMFLIIELAKNYNKMIACGN
ncbi:MAG: hypothetical protein V4548_08815 [Bacteroidota bacterium]